MASLMYIVRTTKTDADASIKVKMRLNAYIGKDEKGKPKKVSAYALSGVVIPKKIWDVEKNAIRKMYLKDDVEGGLYKSYNTTLGEIEAWVNARYNALGSDVVFTSEWLQGVVDDYWADIKRKEDAEREKQEAEAKKESLNAYIARYIEEISNGTRLTNKGTIYKHGTVKAIKASMTQFAEFQQANGISLNFDDIDLEFYRQYTAWLTRKGYTLNSLGKCIKDIKVIMTAAKDDELTTNEAYKAKKFRVTAEEADNIYLTKEELEAIAEVDLSKMAKGYEIARDVFLAGCCLAQRVSDYNRLTPYNVVTEVHKSIGENDEIIKEEVTYIVIDQQKENVRVRIPANKMMLGLLAKYNNHLPYIWEQKLNQYIKVVAEMAGITEEVPITSTKGGKRETANIRKCDLVKTHTARRTGATLMYLSGMDLYDICKITGHTNIKNLRKYIKADELDVATKITKYDYFKN